MSDAGNGYLRGWGGQLQHPNAQQQGQVRAIGGQGGGIPLGGGGVVAPDPRAYMNSILAAWTLIATPQEP